MGGLGLFPQSCMYVRDLISHPPAHSPLLLLAITAPETNPKRAVQPFQPVLQRPGNPATFPAVQPSFPRPSLSSGVAQAGFPASNSSVKLLRTPPVSRPFLLQLRRAATSPKSGDSYHLRRLPDGILQQQLWAVFLHLRRSVFFFLFR